MTILNTKTCQIEGQNNLVIDRVRPMKGEDLSAFIDEEGRVRVESPRETELRRKTFNMEESDPYEDIYENHEEDETPSDKEDFSKTLRLN